MVGGHGSPQGGGSCASSFFYSQSLFFPFSPALVRSTAKVGVGFAVRFLPKTHLVLSIRLFANSSLFYPPRPNLTRDGTSGACQVSRAAPKSAQKMLGAESGRGRVGNGSGKGCCLPGTRGQRQPDAARSDGGGQHAACGTHATGTPHLAKAVALLQGILEQRAAGHLGQRFFSGVCVTTAVGRGLSDALGTYSREEKAVKPRQHSVPCIAGQDAHLACILMPSIVVQSFLLLKLLFLW